MKAFITVACILAGANSAPQFLARGAGQVSHQSVSKPFQGEHRSTVQSKAFGAGIASVSDAPNRLHGARGVIGHPVAHAVHAAPLISHAPVVHAAPAFAHAPVVHAAHAIAHPVAAGYAAPDLAEVSPYSYNYAVADDYSGAAFNQAETNDGTGVVEGSYSVNLPDGRIQHVNYHANDYDGFISDVSYEGTAAYPEAIAHGPVVAHAAPVLSHTIAHPVAHAVAHPVAHAIAAPLTHAVAHPVAHAVAAPLTHTVSHPVSHAVPHPVAHTVAHPFGHAVSPFLG